MEWTWLKDWWRLKKYRSQQRRRKLKHAHLGDPSSSSSAFGPDGNYDENNDCARGAIGVEGHRRQCGATDDNGEIDPNNTKCRMQNRRKRRSRLRSRRRCPSGREAVINKENANNNDDIKNETGDAVAAEEGIAAKQDNAGVNDADNKEDEEFEDGYDDYYDDDEEDYDDDDDEVDDFCYCDECLNGDTDFCESNDGMDSDASTSSNTGKQVVVGICAMAKKTQSKPMKEILTRLQEFEFIKMVIFEEDVILKEPVENWPICDCLVSFHSKGFPLEKAIQYAQLRKPYVLNNLHMQYDIQDRRRVYAILEKEGIEIPRYAVLDRDSPDPKQHELIESEDHVEVNGIIFNKPFVEKPVSAEDHNIYIYYPTSAGGGSQRLFRKIGSRSSVYSPESRVRKTGSFIYEDFMPTDVYFPGTDVKVYTVGPDYAHAEARKSPALDGKVERDSEGKEIRYPVILNHAEKLISRKVCLAFKQTVCGFDLLRANGKSFVCDVNGFSFVKNSNKYYDDCAKILGNMILRELTPTLHIPWSVPFQLDDPPIVPTTFGKMMELRCVVAVIRHGDRTPKQKMKVEVRHPKFFEIFEKYDGFKNGHVKLKRPKQLQEILDIARFLLAEIETKDNPEIEEKKSKLEQLKSVLEMYGHFSGINRKVQMKYQPKGRPRGSSSDDGNNVKNLDAPSEPSLVLILKWGGELTPAGRIQAEELGRIFRCMYPGGQGRQDYSGTQGLGLLRLHSTFRHDLKIYASDEGRVQMTAAAFAKGLLALEGELTPILVQMVKSANTNGLLDNDCDSSKYQNMAKNRLHELMQVDREFTAEDRAAINPNNSISINQALDFVKNPVECCNHVHSLIKELLIIISVKKDDPKTKDAILYHGETWDLMRCRWEKIEKDFSTKSKLYDISKIPDIYDCIKYDLQHNQHTLQYDQAEELYIYAKYLADIVIPQEYGLTMQEKLTIGQGICTPLLKKIKSDLQRNIEEVEDESVNRLNPQYSHGVASPGRHVRTRLYFTSESHVHSLLTVLRYGGLLNVLTDEQWRRAMDYISMVSELNYMSQIVIMLYEDPTKDPTSEERFHVELHFSPGVNCCVQKNLPPGPGFRPHSRNDSGTLKTSTHEECSNNPSRIDEENDTDESPVKTHLISPDGFDCEIRHSKSKPIPIGSHHTVAGHEAMDLAKRLNKELASQQQQQTKQTGSLEANRPISPDGEPRSRSFEQRSQKSKELDMDLLPTTNQPPNSSSSNQLTDDLTPAQRPYHMHYHHHIHHHHHHHHYHIHPHAGHYRLYSLSSRPSTINTTTSTTNTTNPSNSSSSNLLLSASHDNDNDLNETNNDEFPISSASFFPTTITITTTTNTLRPTPPCITINDDHTPYNNTHAPSPYKKLQKTISLDYSSTPPSNIFDNYNDHENNATTDPIISSIINNPPITDTTTDNTVTSTSSSSSVSSRRQRHSIAGQMSYMKMLGFGGFSKKMTTSANSLFSTAVISGSSSAPNLRDMIPVSSSVFPLTVLDGFGGVPPIRPLETLHNALSLKQLDNFLEKMTSAPLFKTPTCTPPKNPSTPLSMMTTITDEDICSATASTPTNNICRCNDNSILNEKNPERCGLCGYQIRNAVPDAESTPVAAGGDHQQQQRLQTTNSVAAGSSLWSKQSSIASSITEPSSPAISDTYSQETPSCEMSISLTSNEGGNYSLPPSSATAAKLARFFPRLDGDLNTVSVYTPMNLDSLDSNDTEFNMGAIGGGGGGGPGGKSACLTPVSFNMDLSIVANKGSLTLSVDGFEDEDATPSAATTPSLPHDEGPQLEMCYCCDGHAESDQPPDDDAEQSTELFSSMRNKRLDENEPKVTCCCHADEEPPLSAGPTFGDPVPPLLSIRKASDTISPKIQKQISLFESGDIDRQKDYAALHASINIPQPNSLQLKQDARLRKFENLTQSTSNSNFPFESNTLKRVPNNVEDFVDVNLTQSCINLKTSDVVASDLASGGGSPQHKASQSAIFRPITMLSEMGSASGPASPRPGALIVKEKFIEPPKRITRSFHGKTQSMDADFLFNEFLLVPAQAPNTQQNSSSSEAGSSSTSPSTNRPNKRFTTTKVLDEALQDVDKV
ncbi:inositol hexakisphosphate and diphosphoinositol-pentakisphosphate kinase-like isoform X13 [Musca domestica]|uniref:diphosphoinositol-pentakisphosphate 1-kinase n=1 Tax=Musca domestica TaxID=7370 RepID=A0ABM3UTV6_MUSDO|nr:inositol hexakisphosphate and diphosphoinositol-pentakisphosphate kinase-like isoform X13 [Musca domestica]